MFPETIQSTTSGLGLQLEIRAKVNPKGRDAINRELEIGMKDLVVAIRNRARRLVPKKSWALHNSLRTSTAIENGVVVGYVRAGWSKSVRYARYVEYGTSRMKAQPYLRPALLQSTAADLRRRRGGEHAK